MGTLIVFSTYRNDAAHHERECFDDWGRFQESSIDPSGFWIDKSWSGDIGMLADQIRRSPWWDRLVFTEDPTDSQIIDGTAKREEAAQRIARSEIARHGLNIDVSSLIPAEKLLLYLYVRGDHELVPVYTPQAKSLYVYPIVEYLGNGESDPGWVERVVQSQLLSRVRLINRIRLCRECGSGHLSFVDVCPSCASIEINHTPSLHCFTCGHTSRKSDFELEGTLVCPKCQAQLRHIGVDYDLPTAQYVCRHCHSFAMEARVVAHCLDCDTKDDPERLEVSEIHSLSLSSKGMEALRQGQFHESFTVTDAGNHVMPAYFKHLLQWSILTQQRNDQMSFGVLLFEFTNIAELLSLHGAAKVSLMMREFMARLRQVLRASDVTSIDTAERLWVLLPFSSPEHIEARLLAKSKEIQPSSGGHFNVRIASVHVPRDMAAGESPEKIMQTLAR